MRPDEGGCADLRRSLAAHNKVVRSHTSVQQCRTRGDPMRGRGPHAGAVRRSGGARRSVPPPRRRPARLPRSARRTGTGPGRGALTGRVPVGACDGRERTGSVLGLGHRPVLGHRTPHRHRPVGPSDLALRAQDRPGDRAQPPGSAAPAASSTVEASAVGVRAAGATGAAAAPGPPPAPRAAAGERVDRDALLRTPGGRGARVRARARGDAPDRHRRTRSRSRADLDPHRHTLELRSTARRPKGTSVRSSTGTRSPAAVSRSPSSRTVVETAPSPLTARTTVWTGAGRGGRAVRRTPRATRSVRGPRLLDPGVQLLLLRPQSP